MQGAGAHPTQYKRDCRLKTMQHARRVMMMGVDKPDNCKSCSISKHQSICGPTACASLESGKASREEIGLTRDSRA